MRKSQIATVVLLVIGLLLLSFIAGIVFSKGTALSPQSMKVGEKYTVVAMGAVPGDDHLYLTLVDQQGNVKLYKFLKTEVSHVLPGDVILKLADGKIIVLANSF